MGEGIALPEAVRRLRMAMPRPGVESVPTAQAVGRVLARAAKTRRASPPADVSAMDGFAFRSRDAPGRLLHAGWSRPGQAPAGPVQPGQCWSVFTGAPLPLGADVVVPLEDAKESDGAVDLPAYEAGTHVVAAGSACPAGIPVAAGTRITVPVAACLAAAGTASVKVYRRLPVRLVPLGSELVSGAVPDVLSPLLAHQLEAHGCAVAARPSVQDDEQAVVRALEGPEPLVVTTGGTGPSASDLVARLGRQGLILDGINVKPGRPTKAIRLNDGRLWVALPGNPVSALLVAVGVLLPALRQALEGAGSPRPRQTVAQPIPGHESRWRIAPVETTAGGLRPVAVGPSVAPGWLRDATGVVVVPPGEVVPAGADVEVLPW